MMSLHHQDEKEFYCQIVNVLYLVQTVKGFVVKGVLAGSGCVVIVVGIWDATGMMIAVKNLDFLVGPGVPFQQTFLVIVISIVQNQNSLVMVVVVVVAICIYS